MLKQQSLFHYNIKVTGQRSMHTFVEKNIKRIIPRLGQNIGQMILIF